MGAPQDTDFRDGMPFLGGRLWIDFVNSAPVALGDLIATPEGWRRWLAAAGLASTGDAARDDPSAAHALRAALARLFEALHRSAPPRPEDVALVNSHLEKAAASTRLDLRDGALAVSTRRAGEGDPLVAIATDFADFVHAFEGARLRHCANPECSLVFYDTARNGTRRWCSMAACGNRHKVRSHRARAAGLQCD